MPAPRPVRPSTNGHHAIVEVRRKPDEAERKAVAGRLLEAAHGLRLATDALIMLADLIDPCDF